MCSASRVWLAVPEGSTSPIRPPSRRSRTWSNGEDGLVPWSTEGFADDVRTLHGVRSHVMALAQLVHGKSTPRDDPEDAAKDLADLSVLSQIAAEPVADPSDDTP